MQVAFAVAEYADIVTLRNDVGDVLQGQASIVAARPHPEIGPDTFPLLQCVAKRPHHFLKFVDALFVRTGTQPGAGSSDRHLQTGRFERLGDIINGMRVKGPLRQMVECRHEYRRGCRRTQPFEKIEAGMKILGALVKADLAQWKQVVADTGAKVD